MRRGAVVQSVEMVPLMRLLPLFTLMLLLTACSTGPGPHPAPIQEGGGSAPTSAGGPEAIPETPQERTDPAVTALLAEADRESSSGRWGSAAAAVERALNLEPKNAYLWHRFALLRLQQGNWQQAYVLANKSNSLIRNDPALKLGNWRVIAAAKRKLGNAAAADQAEEEIKKLEQGKQ
jgi:tetratricopeptide (TPR) repeat protein